MEKRKREINEEFSSEKRISKENFNAYHLLLEFLETNFPEQSAPTFAIYEFQNMLEPKSTSPQFKARIFFKDLEFESSYVSKKEYEAIRRTAEFALEYFKKLKDVDKDSA
jgi:hypothetical protein